MSFGVLLKAARAGFVLALVATALLTLPAASSGHAERESFFPNPDQGNFPEYRTRGPLLVVCKADSRKRINLIRNNRIRHYNLDLLQRCQFRHIQRAVNRAKNGYRIAVLPGHYREEPSLGPAPPGCAGTYTKVANGEVLSYEEQRQCPNAGNLIAVMGDTNGNRICDSKCNLQIEGTGDTPDDVLIEGDRTVPIPQNKLNLIRADRADGIIVKNVKTLYSDFNNIYVIETNGFRLSEVITGYSREYGILSFTSDHGIYENCEAYGSGDSGLYPGAGPDARHGTEDVHGHVYGIIIRGCDSHHNNLAYSGTAGNGIWAHHNKFHHNAIGFVTDSLVPNHPGMPQDNTKWSQNLIYSNNDYDVFSAERDTYCQQPSTERDPTVVCPSFMAPVGSGMLIAGGNSNIVEENYIFDNWRDGTMLHWVPAALREEQDAQKLYDTSGNNRYLNNCMGVRPASLDPNVVDFSQCSGTADPNGNDFWWDEEEGRDCAPDTPGCVDNDSQQGNCWSGNEGPGGATPSSDPVSVLLPACPGLDLFRPGSTEKQAFLVPCATWNPETNTDPPGCDWFTPRPEP